MRKKPLDDAAVARLPPVTTEKLHPVGGSLYLKRRPNGRQTWVLRTRPGGKWKVRQLGDWPSISIHMARERAEAARRNEGWGDGDSCTVAEALEDFKRVYIGQRYRREASKRESGAMLDKALLRLKPRAMASLRRGLLIKTIDPLHDRPNTATKTLALLKQFTAWAALRGMVESDPLAGVTGTGLGLKSYEPRDRLLTLEELRALWVRNDDDAHVLKFCALTACRIGEALAWKPEQMEGDLWTIPETKNGKAHTLPLSPAALELLPLPDPRPVYVSMVQRMKTAGLTWRPHDVRRTAATMLRAAGVSVFDIEAVLNHLQKRLVRIYQLHDPLDEKRAALARLAEAIGKAVAS